jgi:hypothetical protein
MIRARHSEPVSSPGGVSPIVIQGWVFKQPTTNNPDRPPPPRQWRRRWAVLRAGSTDRPAVLEYGTSPTSERQERRLVGETLVVAVDAPKGPSSVGLRVFPCFDPAASKSPRSLQLAWTEVVDCMGGDGARFEAATLEDLCDVWITALTSVIAKKSFVLRPPSVRGVLFVSVSPSAGEWEGGLVLWMDAREPGGALPAPNGRTVFLLPSARGSCSLKWDGVALLHVASSARQLAVRLDGIPDYCMLSREREAEASSQTFELALGEGSVRVALRFHGLGAAW